MKGFPGGSDGKVSACNAGDQVRSLDQEDPLEKGMATHSDMLSRKTPWTEEPCGLQSMGSQRVRHNWASEHACIHACRVILIKFFFFILLNILKNFHKSICYFYNQWHFYLILIGSGWSDCCPLGTPHGCPKSPSSTIWAGLSVLPCTPHSSCCQCSHWGGVLCNWEKALCPSQKSSFKQSAWNLQLCLYSLAPETPLDPKLGITTAWPLLLCVHCRTNDSAMLMFEKILTGGSPAASLACQDELFVLDRATVFPAFPEAPGLFLVPGEDQDVGGKRVMDLHLVILY